MADLTSIQKVITAKAEAQQYAEVNEFKAAVKATALYRRWEQNTFSTNINIPLEPADGRSMIDLIKNSSYFERMRKKPLLMYEDEQARELMKKFDNLTDIIS